MTWTDRRTLIAAGLALAATPAVAQINAGLVRVVMKTGKGLITLDLNAGKAPITTRNFLRYVDARRFDGARIYRASRADGDPNVGVIEGGLQGDPAKVFKPIAFESTLKTGLTHGDGTIAMASSRPGTATADFFICVGAQPSFDATLAAPESGFAAFGQVTDGMDVVRAILASRTDLPTKFKAMKGEMLNPPVTILTARRI
jgi:peptidyl-prolyl cis-trans isomerase A (cyclophilin A)